MVVDEVSLDRRPCGTWWFQAKPFNSYATRSLRGRRTTTQTHKHVLWDKMDFKNGVRQVCQILSNSNILCTVAEDRRRWAAITEEASVWAPQRRLGVTGSDWLIDWLIHITLGFQFASKLSDAEAGKQTQDEQKTSTGKQKWPISNSDSAEKFVCHMGKDRTRLSPVNYCVGLLRINWLHWLLMY